MYACAVPMNNHSLGGLSKSMSNANFNYCCFRTFPFPSGPSAETQYQIFPASQACSVE